MDDTGCNIIERDGYLYKTNTAGNEEYKSGVVWLISEEINRKQYVLDDGNYTVKLSGYDALDSEAKALVFNAIGDDFVNWTEYTDFQDYYFITLEISFGSTTMIPGPTSTYQMDEEHLDKMNH